MIIYANGKTLGTDKDGNTQAIGVSGPEQDELKIFDHDSMNLLGKILKEMRIMNMHMTKISDEEFDKSDLGV